MYIFVSKKANWKTLRSKIRSSLHSCYDPACGCNITLRPHKRTDNCRPHFPQLRSVFMIQQKARDWKKWHAGESYRAKAIADQKEHKSSSRICQKTFWWLLGKYSGDWLKDLKGFHLITSGVKLTQHFIQRTPQQQWNMVRVVWSSPASGSGWPAITIQWVAVAQEVQQVIYWLEG